MSDLHLGSRQSQTDKILKFLEENEMETLILNGDIIDGWAIRSNGKWTNDCTRIIRKIIKLSEGKTKVIYIRGNHDDFLKDFIPFQLNNIQILRMYKQNRNGLFWVVLLTLNNFIYLYHI